MHCRPEPSQHFPSPRPPEQSRASKLLCCSTALAQSLHLDPLPPLPSPSRCWCCCKRHAPPPPGGCPAARSRCQSHAVAAAAQRQLTLSSAPPMKSFCRSFRQISRWSSPAPATMCSPVSSITHCRGSRGSVDETWFRHLPTQQHMHTTGRGAGSHCTLVHWLLVCAAKLSRICACCSAVPGMALLMCVSWAPPCHISSQTSQPRPNLRPACTAPRAPAPWGPSGPGA